MIYILHDDIRVYICIHIHTIKLQFLGCGCIRRCKNVNYVITWSVSSLARKKVSLAIIAGPCKFCPQRLKEYSATKINSTSTSSEPKHTRKRRAGLPGAHFAVPPPLRAASPGGTEPVAKGSNPGTKSPFKGSPPRHQRGPPGAVRGLLGTTGAY